MPREAGSRDGILAYAEDDDLLRPFTPGEAPRLKLYRPTAPMLVLGRGSRPELELRLEACAADGIPVRRRPGGGCAVLLDPGNLVVSLALPLPGWGGIREAYDRITEGLIGALGALGVAGVRREGACDLALEDRKIGGGCIYRRPGLLYYSTTILELPDLERIERYIAHPPREPEYRRGRTHGEFLGSTGSLGPLHGIVQALGPVTSSLPAC